MGSNGSKEDEEDEGLPAKYARGCASTEFSQAWRNNSKYKMIQECLGKNDMDDYTKSCITIYGDKSHDESSLLLLNKGKMSNTPPRLQGIGSKQKSYINQLLELRTKNTTEDDSSPAVNVRKNKPKGETSKNQRTTKQNPMRNILKDGGQLINNRHTNDSSFSDAMMLKCDDVTGKKGAFLNRTDLSSDLGRISRPTSASWTGSHSEEISLEGNISGGEGLEHIRSDMTVVPYDQAKARFESGTHKKRLKRNDAYSQLEQLGLGFWNNDQWVPTKVVTLAISDQLSCAGADWPTNYRYRSSFNVQSFRSSYSEIQCRQKP